MILSGQEPVSGTVAVLSVPAGPCSLTLSTSGGTAYIGTSGSVSTANGFGLAAYPIEINAYEGSRACTVFATVAGGTVVTNWLLSTAT